VGLNRGPISTGIGWASPLQTSLLF
jgi:hypothetical protein